MAERNEQKERLKRLPDPLMSSSGQKIAAFDQWTPERRNELLELFRKHVYGRAPVERPETMSFDVLSEKEAMNGDAIQKLVRIQYEGPGGKGALPVLLFLPTAVRRPSPVFLFLNNRSREITNPDRKIKSSFWPAELMISRGYGAAAIEVDDVDPDVDDGFQNGVHVLFDAPNTPRPPDAWGTIAAWAWGASRVMDYFETDPDVDHNEVALVGHSRGGKTALWAGAQDERFAMIVSNNSGCTGAAISRGKQGESIKQINETFPHWFNENYKYYADRETELPLDQHMLLSLIAPRALYVSSASEDAWADPESEFLSIVAAEPIYRMCGYTGLGSDQFPPVERPIHGDRIAYHLRQGKHDLVEYDWRQFIDFFDKIRTARN